MIKCRTCLEDADECTSVNIAKESTLGRTIRDILLLFIPGMVTSSVGELICCKCTRRIRNFTNFIEKCLTVEKLLVEEKTKTLNQNTKEQTLISTGAPHVNNNLLGNVGSTPLSFVYISVPQVKQNGAQNGVPNLQPIQIQPIPINILLQPTNNSTINLGNNMMPVRQIGSQNASQSQLIIVPEIKKPVSTSVVPQPQVTVNNHSTATNETTLDHLTNSKNVNLEGSTVGNRICRNCGDVFTSNDWNTVECSKCAGSEKEIELNLSDVLPNGFDSDDEGNDMEMVTEKDSVSLIKDAKRVTTSDVFKNLRGEFRDTIISVRQPSEQIEEFLGDYSKSNINLIEYGPYSRTGYKRIILLGNSSSQCSECKDLLKNPKLLMIHFQKAHTIQELQSDQEDEDEDHKKIFQCPFCDTKTITGLLLVEHLRQMHKIEKPFKCEKCGKEFKKREVFLEHFKKYEKSSDCSFRKCRFCDEMLNKEGMRKHLKYHRSIVCDQCGRSFVSIHTFKLHYANHQGEDENKSKTEQTHLCPTCGKLLSNRQTWRAHVAIHGQRARNYICHMCPKTFLTSHSLKIHISSSHVEKNIICSICGIKVRTNSALVNHYNLKHSDDYAHKCNICGKGFSRSDYYRRHMNKHAGSSSMGRAYGKKKYNYSVKIDPKPVKCKYCLKVFKNVYLLRTHLMSHVKSIRYKCKFCNMTFANTGTRFRHQKRHADPNFDFSCTICWKRMDNKAKLEAHMAVHEESKKYECTVCKELFCSKYLLKHHMSEQHIPQDVVEKEKQIVLSSALEEFLL
ncbi:zinc finger protein 665 isoform X2 [Anoplophora glabripennis]|uniref:zinc finger protein 665 isoform X2 n=1 Tax=Anoplophora glabripennis TaxID=217634 RepID=UPI0008754C69|nr:zinc finger protein 665 isoform X2 [Anoplophora glabripennis]